MQADSPAPSAPLDDAGLLKAIVDDQLDAVKHSLAKQPHFTPEHFQAAARLPTKDVLEALQRAADNGRGFADAKRDAIKAALTDGSVSVASRLLTVGTAIDLERLQWGMSKVLCVQADLLTQLYHAAQTHGTFADNVAKAADSLALQLDLQCVAEDHTPEAEACNQEALLAATFLSSCRLSFPDEDCVQSLFDIIQSK